MRGLKYLENEKKLFSGRKAYLTTLKQNISKSTDTCIIASPGFGKKTLLKELVRQQEGIRSALYYIDLSKASLSPENLALEYMASFCDTQPNTNSLLQEKMSDECLSLVRTVDNELQKIKPDQQLILRSALLFPEAYAKHLKKRLVIIMDCFEEFLQFNNYSQITKVLDIFTSTIHATAHVQSNAYTNTYVLTTSSALLKKGLAGFEFMELSAFDETEAFEFIERSVGKVDVRLKRELFSLSRGIPAVLKSLCLRYRSASRKSNVSDELALLRRLFVSELTVEFSRTHTYCKELFESSMNNARGSSLLKSLVKVLAMHDDLKLSEIARLLYRSAPVTKSLIERLIEVDLVRKSGSTFVFTNPVLKLWCRLSFQGIGFEEEPDDETLDEISNRLGGMA
ncbi:TPA: hypothetical protein HA265_08400 [Candidatus Woesearchaeota archaeon]|nr:hypothetical protein [Candidatus Woesearchaeota archaeon]